MRCLNHLLSKEIVMKTFVSLTQESLVASDQIVSITVREYMFSVPLKDLTTEQRKDVIDSPNKWGVLATLLNGDTIKIVSGLTREQATEYLSKLISTLNQEV